MIQMRYYFLFGFSWLILSVVALAAENSLPEKFLRPDQARIFPLPQKALLVPTFPAPTYFPTSAYRTSKKDWAAVSVSFPRLKEKKYVALSGSEFARTGGPYLTKPTVLQGLGSASFYDCAQLMKKKNIPSIQSISFDCSPPSQIVEKLNQKLSIDDIRTLLNRP